MQPMYTIQQLQDRLAPVFRKNGLRKATLFGPYSKGVADLYSDVDLAVDSGLRGLRFFGLLEDICTSLDCKVDLIRMDDVIPNSRINQEIGRTGVIIYEQ